MNSRFADESMNWRRLCRSAALERRPDELFEIVEKINLALKTHQRTLRNLAEAVRDRTYRIPSRPKRAA
jgi:hypothetical protein